MTIGIILGLLAGSFATFLICQRRISRLQSEADGARKDASLRQEKVEWMEKAQGEMKESFESLAFKSLKDNSSNFIESAKLLTAPLTATLGELDRKVRELEQKREGAYAELKAHLGSLLDAEQSLRRETTTLSRALQDSGTRGQWGQVELRRIVELAGMTKNVSFSEQVTTEEGRPDLVVSLPNGGKIPVDAKVNLNGYLDAVKQNDPQEKARLLKEFSKNVRTTISQLSQREYQEQFEKTPDFTVMFMPLESAMSAAFEQEPKLLDKALEKNVLIATPVTLLALFKAVAFGWQQQYAHENVKDTVNKGKDLYNRLIKFLEHLGGMKKGLDSAVSSYNSAIGSLQERLLPKAREFQTMAGIAETDRDLLGSGLIELRPRDVPREEQ